MNASRRSSSIQWNTHYVLSGDLFYGLGKVYKVTSIVRVICETYFR